MKKNMLCGYVRIPAEHICLKLFRNCYMITLYFCATAKEIRDSIRIFKRSSCVLCVNCGDLVGVLHFIQGNFTSIV
jgi:hypothetical protein